MNWVKEGRTQLTFTCSKSTIEMNLNRYLILLRVGCSNKPGKIGESLTKSLPCCRKLFGMDSFSTFHLL